MTPSLNPATLRAGLFALLTFAACVWSVIHFCI